MLYLNTKGGVSGIHFNLFFKKKNEVEVLRSSKEFVKTSELAEKAKKKAMKENEMIIVCFYLS